MKNKTFLFLAASFLVCFMMLVSCARQKAEWKGMIEEENGVTIVKNPKEPVYGEDVLSLEEELTVGKSREGEEPVFFDVSGVQADSQGNIYVLDGRDRQVKVFDKEGGKSPYFFFLA